MDKKLLFAEFLYSLDQKLDFVQNLNNNATSPQKLLSPAGTINGESFIMRLQNIELFNNYTSVVGILIDEQSRNKGIILTTNSIYVISDINLEPSFKLDYTNIKFLEQDFNTNKLILHTKDDKSYSISTRLWNIRPLDIFLEFASNHHDYSNPDIDILKNMPLNTLQGYNIFSLIELYIKKFGTTKTPSIVTLSNNFVGTTQQPIYNERLNPQNTNTSIASNNNRTKSIVNLLYGNNPKIILAELLYRLDSHFNFEKKISFWNMVVPTKFLNSNGNIEGKKFFKALEKEAFFEETLRDIVGILGDWANQAEGYIFTTTSLYVYSKKNEEEHFTVAYKDISNMSYDPTLDKLTIVNNNNVPHVIKTKVWYAYPIKLFLEFASGNIAYTPTESQDIAKISLKIIDSRNLLDYTTDIITQLENMNNPPAENKVPSKPKIIRMSGKKRGNILRTPTISPVNKNIKDIPPSEVISEIDELDYILDLNASTEASSKDNATKSTLFPEVLSKDILNKPDEAEEETINNAVTANTETTAVAANSSDLNFANTELPKEENLSSNNIEYTSIDKIESAATPTNIIENENTTDEDKSLTPTIYTTKTDIPYKHKVFQELLYLLNHKFPFQLEVSLLDYLAPETFVQRKGSIGAEEFIKDLKENTFFPESTDNIVGILGDWRCEAKGIIFTEYKMYVNSKKNTQKEFDLAYIQIKNITYIKSLNRLIITKDSGKEYIIDSMVWNKYPIKLFLEFATGNYQYTSEEFEDIRDFNLINLGKQSLGDFIQTKKKESSKVNSILEEYAKKYTDEHINAIEGAGITVGNINNAIRLYGEEKFAASRGHGFAAERANTLEDIYAGKDAKLVGDDNAKNGADRIVNGVSIQSKYCKTGSKCISECFEDNKFRYYTADNKPMQIEVPKDKYEDAINAMKARIEKGEVPGITDPEEAKNIVRQGHYTYEQAKNIAKAGTIESITYDAKTGVITATTAIGITTIITFARELWDGADMDVALKHAALSGLKVGGVVFMTSILSGQLTKAGLNSLLVGTTDTAIKLLGPKGASLFANTFRNGTNIYGAAAITNASKLLRTNVITGIATVAILSIGDISKMFSGKMSGAQLFKNVTTTVASVAGGTFGWLGGAVAGATIGSFIPGVGTTIGGIVGGVLGALGGGSAASGITQSILDEFVEDDAVEMLKIIEAEFTDMASDYLLSKKEADNIVTRLKTVLEGGVLLEMFAAKDRKAFARNILEKLIETEVNERPRFTHIPVEALCYGFKDALEDIYDESQGA